MISHWLQISRVPLGGRIQDFNIFTDDVMNESFWSKISKCPPALKKGNLSVENDSLVIFKPSITFYNLKTHLRGWKTMSKTLMTHSNNVRYHRVYGPQKMFLPFYDISEEEWKKAEQNISKYTYFCWNNFWAIH